MQLQRTKQPRWQSASERETTTQSQEDIIFTVLAAGADGCNTRCRRSARALAHRTLRCFYLPPSCAGAARSLLHLGAATEETMVPVARPAPIAAPRR
jgi:hypothetical protein